LCKGLNLLEVALVAIMDADIENFLRDRSSLIKIIGQTTRNVDAKVILYIDKMTGSLKTAIQFN